MISTLMGINSPQGGWYYGLMALTAVVCYLIGNINWALIISKFRKRDIRKQDSGNPGAMNMVRTFGAGMGAITLFLDMFKGTFAVLLGWFLLGEGELFSFGTQMNGQIGMYIGGLSVIIGHIYPVFLKFKGGKGIASTIGVCLVINPIVTAITFLLGVGFIILFKIGSLGSFIIITPPLALTAYKCAVNASGVFAVIESVLILTIFLLTLWAHRKNIVKLFLGTERKTVVFKKKKKD